MTTDTQKENEDYCPTKEELSNWYDNGGDEKIEEHVVVCPPCEETVGFYKRVDETVRLRAVPPQYLADDIAEACRNIAHESLAFPMWVRLVRIAAIVAVVGTVAAVIQLVTAPEGGSDNRLVTEGEAGPGNGAMSIAEYKTPIHPSAETGNNPGQTLTVGSNELLTVSATGGTARGGAMKNTKAVPISNAVRHVWAVDDVKASQDVLINALPEGVKAPRFARISDEKLIFEAAMSDAQLQTFVNDLQAKGWALFTKDYPQPGKEENVLLTGHPVNYQADLVKKVD